MKYSFMTFSTPELSFAELLEVAGRYGYDGVELRMDAGHAHGAEAGSAPAQRAALRGAAAEAGVALACLATSLKFADPAVAGHTVRETHDRIDLAGDLGIPTMRVFGGAIPNGIGREQAIGQLVDSLGSVAEHAAQRAVTLCLETHDDWCDPAHVATVLRRVNHPAVGANWDVMHPVRTKHATIDESFETLKPWIHHLHIHDGAGDGGGLTPIGEGIVDHRRVIELLKTIEFDGYLSGEWIGWEPYETHLPRELATLRRYEEELA